MVSFTGNELTKDCKTITIEYSTMCLKGPDFLKKIREAEKLVESAGFQFGIQIHNSISREFYEQLSGLRGEVPFTVHSPVLAKYFLNLASDDYELIREGCRDALKYLDDFESDLFFFHGFFMTHSPIIHDMSQYRRTLKKALLGQYALEGSFIMDPDFFNSDDYLIYKKNVIKHLDLIKKEFSGYRISLENDFVGIGSGLQRPEEIMEIADLLWFDIGHLWCASLLHGFDFYEVSEELIEKKEITGVHINHNLMTRNTPKTDLYDSHTHLYLKCDQNLKPIIRKLLDKGLRRYTLEIVDGDIEDIEILLDWILA